MEIKSMHEHEVTGYRFVPLDDGRPSVGAELPPSHHWDGDQRTEEELGGTCSFDSVEAVERYAEWSTGWIVTIGGADAGYGDLAGELIVRRAVVTDVRDWPK